MGWLDEWEKGWLTEGIMRKEVVRVLVGAEHSRERYGPIICSTGWVRLLIVGCISQHTHRTHQRSL